MVVCNYSALAPTTEYLRRRYMDYIYGGTKLLRHRTYERGDITEIWCTYYDGVVISSP